jgi:hypothetical protein
MDDARQRFRHAPEHIADGLRRVGGQSVRILIELAGRPDAAPRRSESTTYPKRPIPTHQTNEDQLILAAIISSSNEVPAFDRDVRRNQGP